MIFIILRKIIKNIVINANNIKYIFKWNNNNWVLEEKDTSLDESISGMKYEIPEGEPNPMATRIEYHEEGYAIRILKWSAE